jgi:hypothetical protein
MGRLTSLIISKRSRPLGLNGRLIGGGKPLQEAGTGFLSNGVPLFQGFKFATGIVLKNTPEPPGCVSSVS